MKLTLPEPSPRYDPVEEARRNEILTQAFGRAFGRGERIEAGEPGVVLRAPNGSRWLLTVSNAGVLGTTAL
ncbi:hypothetical protein [Flavobacterium sp.]|jgi:hypothetical protein|uniref:hypothetical protein n=1 Tax=Flavobacterium sp. TaxID=239 RepID=UPI0037BF6D03